MKKQVGFMMTVLAILFMGLSAQANSKFRCKKTATGVCAQRISTGQCTHEWERGDGGNPMFHCNKFIGKKVSNYSPKNYYCKDWGDMVCAASKRTGQCTHAWSRDDVNDPMWSCQRHLGIRKSSFDKSKFYCHKRGDRVCARSKRTGQCTHVWKREDGGNPMWRCQNWLSK